MRTKERPADLLLRIARASIEQFYRSISDGVLYIRTRSPDCRLLQLGSTELHQWLRSIYYRETEKTVGTETLTRAAETLAMLCEEQGISETFYTRIAFQNGSMYYDLANGQCAVVNGTGVHINATNDTGILFLHPQAQRQQARPSLKGKASDLLPLLQQIFRVSQDDLLLLAVYLTACFFVDIAHPILLIHGKPGSSKTTTLRTLCKIIDPNTMDVLHFPTKEKDLAAVLNSAYVLPFDNLRRLTPEQSDTLCMAVTGGTIPQRQLFTNHGISAVTVKKIIFLDGVSVVATQPDLLERCIIMELQPIKAEERKTEAEYWMFLEEKRPLLLGAVLDAIHYVLKNEIKKPPKLERMADFSVYGYAIAESLQKGLGAKFEMIYSRNQELVQAETKPPMIPECVSQLMMNETRWHGTPTELLQSLRPIAYRLGYKDEFPQSLNALSRQMKAHKSDLENLGICWVQQSSGKRLYKIENKA